MSVSKEKNGTLYRSMLVPRAPDGRTAQEDQARVCAQGRATHWERDFPHKDRGFANHEVRRLLPGLQGRRHAQAQAQHLAHQKEYVIRDKILPFFGEMRLSDIAPADVLAWQIEVDGPRGPQDREALQEDLPAHGEQHALQHPEPCRPLLRPAREPHGEDRQDRQLKARRDAILDEGRVPEVRGGDHGQASLIRHIRASVLVRHPRGARRSRSRPRTSTSRRSC